MSQRAIGLLECPAEAMYFTFVSRMLLIRAPPLPLRATMLQVA